MKRTPMQRRTPLRAKAPPPRPVKRMDDYTPKPRAVAVAVADTRARMVMPVPKAEKARPGKRTPTAEERAWMDAITAIGCIACITEGRGSGVPGAVHHILRAGRRIGHMHTICLCDPGHHQNGPPGVISRHPHKARFEAEYGTEAELLARSKQLVGAIA